jgi:hypothetical protein
MNVSRIPILGMIHPLGISRFQDQDVGGRVKKECLEIVVYEKLPGRSDNLRNLAENADSTNAYGQMAAKIRRFKIAPIFFPGKIKQGDFVRVVWGVKPNTLIPEDAPNWGSPAICIDTPDGEVTLHWSDGKFSSELYSLEFEGGVWVLSGPDLSYSFTDADDFNISPLCMTYPEGYSLIKQTGPSVYYKITRFDHQVDDLGDYHHTHIECEIQDKDNLIPV